MEFKGTPGPLFVRQPETWPFKIEIVDSDGGVVFSEVRMSYSTNHKSVKDVMSAKGMDFKDDPNGNRCRAANEKQLADAYLRAAAHDLLKALKMAISDLEYLAGSPAADCTYISNETIETGRAAIAKALGQP